MTIIDGWGFVDDVFNCYSIASIYMYVCKPFTLLASFTYVKCPLNKNSWKRGYTVACILAQAIVVSSSCTRFCRLC